MRDEFRTLFLLQPGKKKKKKLIKITFRITVIPVYALEIQI